jgi:16S rRNA (cytidine1402-2'-O)-methyltransferase
LKIGTLYIVSTPIGNLEDITLRAIRILKQVNLIACEDTRKTQVLLNHYGIATSTTSYYSYNEKEKAPYLINEIKNGKSIAVVSDAGTPGISDPANYLVRLAIEEKINIVPVPGAVAFVSALVVSGLKIDKFIFEGFLPTKKGRHTLLTELTEEERTMIFYESPYRVLKTLRNFLEYFGERKIVVARELTKKFEEVFRGNISDAIEYFNKNEPRGEFVIIVEGKGKVKR